MPFTNSPTTDDSDAVRVLVGDLSTSTSGELLSDGVYDFLVSRTDTIDEAAAEAARSIAGKFSKDADKRVGRLRISLSQKAKAYLSLAERFDQGVQTANLVAVSPYLGGQSKSDKEAVEEDSDRVDTWFKRESWDFPGGITDTTST